MSVRRPASVTFMWSYGWPVRQLFVLVRTRKRTRHFGWYPFRFAPLQDGRVQLVLWLPFVMCHWTVRW